MSTPNTISSERQLARDQARKLVEDIAKEHGFVSDRTYARMDPEMLREVEEALLNKDKLIGSSVITLAKNLYTSSARFVFELLQNADDNSFSRARSSSSIPFVAFHVHPQRIVVECNEDGFTPENLKAICSVGQSSKTGGQGYIGEKGIGFKSVFMVAWKVLIQSGDFSFCFKHNKEGSGLGMITPVWEDTDAVLDGPLTRMTLFLHETGSEEHDTQKETTLQQFRELQATFLLFMKNLQIIKVSMYEGNQVSSTTFSLHRQTPTQVTLERETTENGASQQHAQHYNLFKFTTSTLPQSETRTYTPEEINNKTYSMADIVLGFPINADSTAMVETQDVFAFLPIRNMGFPFLIHSDFVTDANRQDIVRNSPRNQSILRRVGNAFARAVSEFCKHPTLRYEWMRYLPNRHSHTQDVVWTTLVEAIHAQLLNTPSLWTRSHQKLRLIKDMRRLPQDELDKNGLPLYPDLEPEEYLAPQYLAKDLDLLADYGLGWMGIDGFLTRVRKDLSRQESSIMMSPGTDNDWHSRVAKILLNAWPLHASTIRDLALIPTRNGSWIPSNSISFEPIFYPYVNGYEIPQNISLQLLDIDAQRNCERKHLFDRLGVEKAGLSHIRTMAKFHYWKYDVKPPNSRINLEFFYRTEHLYWGLGYYSYYASIPIHDHLSRKRSQNDTIYFPSDDPYGAQHLFQPMRSEESHIKPDFEVLFLNDHYMSNPPAKPEKETRTWRAWLSEMFCIRDAIPLTRAGQLSKECRYVAKYRPEKFLGFLLKYWKSEGTTITKSQALTRELLDVEVLCKDGTLYPLGKTYVYGKGLEYADKFIQEGEFFPWLRQEASSSDAPKLPDLEILTSALDFGYPKSELEFYLTILQFIKKANQNAMELSNASRVYELYGRIKSRCYESGNSSTSRKAILDTFKADCLVFVPAYGDCNAIWTHPGRCRWEAPATLSYRYPLKARYGHVDSTKHFADLFLDTLEIRDAGIDDFLSDLCTKKVNNIWNFEQIYKSYQELDLRRPEMDSATVNKAQKFFKKYGLIWHEDEDTRGWYAPSECLWSTAIEIKDKVVLNGLYEELQDFFVEFLDVRSLTLEMVHDKLLEQANEGTPIHEVKKTIWLLNSYLRDEEKPPNPKKIAESKVFPVKYPNGAIHLCSLASGFAIKDRKHLSDMFSGKAKFLDFEVNDTPLLEPFLRWIGLENDYLSSRVKEISRLCDDYHQSLTRRDRQVARKARALLRIAVHFRSPRAVSNERSFYDLLKNIDVRETDGIRSEVHLNQDGNDISVEVSRSEFHLGENDDGLTIYVPRDEELQYLCFYDRLPRELLEYIMTDPTTRICEPFDERAVSIIHKVLHAQGTYVAPILDRAGIFSVQTPEDEANDNFEVTSPSQSSAEQGDLAQTPDSSTLQADTDEITTSFSRLSHGPPHLVYYDDNSTRGTPQPRTAVSSSFDPSQLLDSKYRGLLSRVVTAARRATIPEISQHFDYAPAPGYFNEDRWFDRLEKGERDKRIGAAGELFVFEILSRLDPALSGFSLDNWQSKIRHYVSVHDEYSGIQPWRGSETSDFRYTDSCGTLTSMLIDKGYLRSNIWSGKRPEYYLEIKSTTGPCENPFYMSMYQYQTAQRLSYDQLDSGNCDAIYVVIRIFNLVQDSVGMKIYVDPNALRRQEELIFTTETWSIVPGAGRGGLPN